MGDIPWNEIVRRIQSRQLTPFLGAGISRPPLPSGGELADALAHECSYPFRNRDLMAVSQFMATTLDGAAPKAVVQDIFNRIADPDFSDPEQPHTVLASLPVPVYLTTNYDDYMQKALRAGHRSPQTEVCRWNSALRRRPSVLAETEPEVGQPVVFHVHGHIDDLDSCVLTEDDYLDFMVNVRRFEAAGEASLPVLPAKVDELISTTSLLFLGYGLRDWDLRVLLRALVEGAERSSQKLGVSVQLAPDDTLVEELGRDAALEYLETYFAGLRMRVYWGTAQQFLIELKQRWDAAVPAPAAR